MGSEYLLCHFVDDLQDKDGTVHLLGIALFDATEPKGLRVIFESEGLNAAMKAGNRYRLPDGVDPNSLETFERYYLRSRAYCADGYLDDLGD